jgi:hypothetical protein
MWTYRATIKPTGRGAARAELVELDARIRARDENEAEAIAETLARELSPTWGPLEVDSVA